MMKESYYELIDVAFSKTGLDNKQQQEFDHLIKTSAEFKSEVEFRTSLKQSLYGLQVKEIARRVHQKQKLLKFIKIIGASVFGGVLLSMVCLWYLNKDHEMVLDFIEKVSIELPETELDYVEGEMFEYNSNEAHVFESENGTVMVIPESAFEDTSGHVVEYANVRLQEYFTSEDIILSGLSTVSDGEELESCGMFNITATDRNGVPLKLRKGKEILFEVPTEEKKQGMQIFDGLEDSVGRVNWVNPQKIENEYLTTVDINSLDFYPPGYLKKLDDLGYGNKSKTFKDSLFYSFSCCSNFDLEEVAVSEEVIVNGLDSTIVVYDEIPYFTEERSEESPCDKKIELGKYKTVMETHPIFHTRKKALRKYVEGKDVPFFVHIATKDHCGITSSVIKAIWNKKYQNTYIATKEFEERLKVIYSTCDLEVLNIYLSSLSQPLLTSDRRAFIYTGDTRFRDFYNRGTRGVKVSDELQMALNNYFIEKSKLYEELVQKANQAYFGKQRELDAQARQKFNQNAEQNRKREYENYWKEFEKNVHKANKDLGTEYKFKKGIGIVSRPPSKKYRFRVTTLGAKNIDRFLKDVMVNRETANYSENGKETTISFKKQKVTLPVDSFDLVRVYLTSKELFSFIRMNQKSNDFSYSKNESLSYNLVVVAKKGNKTYFYGALLPKDKIYLTFFDFKRIENLSKELMPFSKLRANNEIESDLEFERFKLQNQIRQNKMSSLMKMRTKLEPIIFPCREDDLQEEE